MSVILGINTSHAGSSAAILVDCRPIIAIAEERLNRVKYYLDLREDLRFEFQDLNHLSPRGARDLTETVLNPLIDNIIDRGKHTG